MSPVVAAVPAAPVGLEAGDRMPGSRFGPITPTHIVRYAGAGGDLNPIHHDERVAKAAGMPGIFAMGMMHAGMLGERLAAWLGPDNLREFEVRFTGQVWPGDVLDFHAEVHEVVRNGDCRARISAFVTRTPQGGDPEQVVKASALARVATPK